MATLDTILIRSPNRSLAFHTPSYSAEDDGIYQVGDKRKTNTAMS